jgi:hypothetical protein
MDATAPRRIAAPALTRRIEREGSHDVPRRRPHDLRRRTAYVVHFSRSIEANIDTQTARPPPTRAQSAFAGWMNYFSSGYPSSAYCEIERYVRDRLIRDLQRRSQRPYCPPPGEGWLQHLANLGLIPLSGTAHA